MNEYITKIIYSFLINNSNEHLIRYGKYKELKYFKPSVDVLYTACLYNRETLVVDILKFLQYDLDSISCHMNNTCLYKSSLAGHMNLVEFFVKRIKPKDSTQDICILGMIYAIRGGHLNIVKYFIKKFDLKNYERRGIIEASKEGRMNIIRFFQRKGAVFDNSCLYFAAKIGNKKLINKILNSEINEKKEININYGLLGASYYGRLDIVKFFIKKGANWFSSALIDSAHGGHLDLVEFFYLKIKNENKAVVSKTITKAMEKARFNHERVYEFLRQISRF